MKGLWRCAVVAMLTVGVGACSSAGSGGGTCSQQEVADGACSPRHDVCGSADDAVPCPSDVCSRACPDARQSGDCGPGPGDASAQETAPGLCTASPADLEAENLASIRRFALLRATAIFEGDFGMPTEVQGESCAPFTIEKVHYGWSFLAGMKVLLPVPGDVAGGLSGAPHRVVAVSANHPSEWEYSELPWGGNVLANIPEDEAAALAGHLSYRTELTSHVAVVRIVAQDEYRTTFEVQDALLGTFPATFSDNWYASWNLPYPEVDPAGGQAWIASVSGLTEYAGDPAVVLGTVIDFRPATAENLAAVKGVLAAPVEPHDRDALRAARDRYRDGFRFHRSPLVVSSVVVGLAEECCTGAGGTYVDNEVTGVLQGAAAGSRFITGGHAYYGDEECGDAFVLGLDELVDPTEVAPEGFDCLAPPTASSWDPFGAAVVSPVNVGLPLTDANRQAVESWVAASEPLYQLYDLKADVPPEAVVQDPADMPWSVPVDAVEAFLMATHIVLFTVKEATYDPAADLHRVIVSTTFSIYEHEHLVKYDAALVFRCGDPRLLLPGSRWIGPLVLLDSWSYDPAAGPALEQAFLIPGVLLPESVMSSQLESDLSYYLN